MAPDIDAVTKLLQEGKVWQAVEGFMQDANNNR